MPAPLFDMRLRTLRRDRAFAMGPELFLYDRIFEDCLERIALHQRQFTSALLLGCPNPNWPARLSEIVESVVIADPGPAFAEVAGGKSIIEDDWTPDPAKFDLCLAIGTLDSVNDLPHALQAIRCSLRDNSLLIGAVSGGDTLPRLRAALHAADRVMGAATPHAHPRIEAAALAPLLTACGFTMPVVDVERVQVSYASFDALLRDLRAMGATNVLNARSRRPLSRAAREAAAEAFMSESGRTIETFEVLHFAAWTPTPQQG